MHTKVVNTPLLRQGKLWKNLKSILNFRVCFAREDAALSKSGYDSEKEYINTSHHPGENAPEDS